MVRSSASRRAQAGTFRSEADRRAQSTATNNPNRQPPNHCQRPGPHNIDVTPGITIVLPRARMHPSRTRVTDSSIAALSRPEYPSEIASRTCIQNAEPTLRASALRRDIAFDPNRTALSNDVPDPVNRFAVASRQELRNGFHELLHVSGSGPPVGPVRGVACVSPAGSGGGVIVTEGGLSVPRKSECLLRSGYGGSG
jgi:hypothetical protein